MRYAPIRAALRDCCSALPPYRWIAGDEAFELFVQCGRCGDDVATALELMGFEFPGKEMALGVSGVGTKDVGKYSIYDVPDLDNQLRRPSELYNVFWDIDDNRGS